MLGISGCSKEPTSKYSSEEECAFKEAKECEDKNCAVLAVGYCKESFRDFKAKEEAKQQAFLETCRTNSSPHCPKHCGKEPPTPQDSNLTLDKMKHDISCRDYYAGYCTQKEISKRREFLKINKCP